MTKSEQLQEKLERMRAEYRTSTPAYKKFLEAGAKLLHMQLEKEKNSVSNSEL